jgi:hypothetical protein
MQMKKWMINDVEVISIDRTTKQVDIRVHVNATPFQLTTEDVQRYADRQIDFALKYLMLEAFIDPPSVCLWRVKGKVVQKQ